MEDHPTDSYNMNVTFLKIHLWCERAEIPFIFTSWPSCHLHFSFSGMRKEVRGGFLGQHRMCLTSHELHTPVHKAICHTQPHHSRFISQRGKPHQTPSPARHRERAELKVILLLSTLVMNRALPYCVQHGMQQFQNLRCPQKAENSWKGSSSGFTYEGDWVAQHRYLNSFTEWKCQIPQDCPV